jgi:hypothetical protein
MSTDLEAVLSARGKIRPERVVTNAYGEAVPYHRAHAQGNEPDIVFIRRDGWTLGAPAQFEGAAYSLWADEWLSFWRKGDKKISPIEEYQA